MATKQELFTKVTGLTFDVEEYIDANGLDKLAWLVPDGAMLQGDKSKNRKAQETAEFLAAVGIEEASKIDIYDAEEDDDDSSSNND